MEARPNKAHTATANRIAKRYESIYNPGEGFDIKTPHFAIEVETTATLAHRIDRLQQTQETVFVALTNKEGVREALRLVRGTRVGVMDARGNIVRTPDDPDEG